MEPDIYALSKAGFSKERIEEIFMQYRKLPKGAEQISVLGIGTSSIQASSEQEIAGYFNC